MYMSSPAISASGQFSLVAPGNWPWPFQSPMTGPSNAQCSLMRPVSRVAAAVHVARTPRGERRHDRLHARFDCRAIAGGVDVAQRRFIAERVALIAAAARAAVTDEVLPGGRDLAGAEESSVARRAALQATDEGDAEIGDELRIGRERFVSASPAHVLYDRERRREGPIEAGDSHF